MAVLITDENGKIKGVARLEMKNLELPIAENAADIIKTESGTLGRVGTKGSALSLADHVHPYSTAWMNDMTWVEFVNKKAAVEEWVSDRMAEEFNKSGIEMMQVLGEMFAQIVVALAHSTVISLQIIAPVVSMILGGLISHGISKIKDEDDKEYDVEDMKNKIDEKYKL